jgi:hypothetical protein
MLWDEGRLDTLPLPDVGETGRPAAGEVGLKRKPGVAGVAGVVALTVELVDPSPPLAGLAEDVSPPLLLVVVVVTCVRGVLLGETEESLLSPKWPPFRPVGVEPFLGGGFRLVRLMAGIALIPAGAPPVPPLPPLVT